MKLAMLAFTDKGNDVLKRISSINENSYIVYDKSIDDLKPWLKERFLDCDGIIFVGAIGIAVRLISPYIVSKDKDPAVLVIDELGKYVIPILSGHIGKGNKLSIELATKLEAVPIITTATDLNGKLAIDVWATENDAAIKNIDTIKHISSRVLRDDEVLFKSDFPIAGELPKELRLADSGECGVMVSLSGEEKPFDITLNIIPRAITLGIGCRRDTEKSVLKGFVDEVLSKEGISAKAVRAIASIDLKKDEGAILSYAEENNISTYFYEALELSRLGGDFTKSDFVKRTTGVDNVCERAAILCSGGELILKKTSRDGMTIAIAKSIWRCRF